MAEGGGLLNRYTVNSRIVGSNPIPSASSMIYISALRNHIGYRIQFYMQIGAAGTPPPDNYT